MTMAVKRINVRDGAERGSSSIQSTCWNTKGKTTGSVIINCKPGPSTVL